MTTSHRRAARRELEVAKALGSKRVKRSRFEKAPDVEPVELPGLGWVIPEVKTRRSLPKLLTKALEQARAYAPNATPIAVLSETGKPAIACLPLTALVALLARVAPERGEQLTLR